MSLSNELAYDPLRLLAHSLVGCTTESLAIMAAARTKSLHRLPCVELLALIPGLYDDRPIRMLENVADYGGAPLTPYSGNLPLEAH
jgi:hypothetical protein